MTTLALPPAIDLTAAAALAETLRAATGPVVLKAGGVERIGAAGLQMLLSAQATLEGAGHAMTIDAPSVPFVAAATTAGATTLLGNQR